MSDGELRFKLSGEAYLAQAETILHDWALILAEASRDREAAECLRLEQAILALRCDFIESEKAP